MKPYELSHNRNVYYGSYQYEMNKLVIETMFTRNDEEQEVEVDSFSDSEVFQRVYQLLVKEKFDEIEEEKEELIKERSGMFGRRFITEENQAL